MPNKAKNAWTETVGPARNDGRRHYVIADPRVPLHHESQDTEVADLPSPSPIADKYT